VRDWGPGFNPKTVRPTAAGGRIGLTSMRERMHLLTGRLEVRSRRNLGTTARAILPVFVEKRD
jgi:signal transduction histidine kinase